MTHLICPHPGYAADDWPHCLCHLNTCILNVAIAVAKDYYKGRAPSDCSECDWPETGFIHGPYEDCAGCTSPDEHHALITIRARLNDLPNALEDVRREETVRAEYPGLSPA